MHYSLDWLWDIRDLHAQERQLGVNEKQSKVKVDYELVQKVLAMRPDLVEGWAKRVTAPLNSFDLFMLAMHTHSLPENVSNCIDQSRKSVEMPPWLSQEKAIYVRERFASLLSTQAVDFNRASFEDFVTESDRVDYLEYLLQSSNGQVELGMFLGKGLISKDELFNDMAMDYLETSIQYHAKFPQVIDHIYTAITVLEPERSHRNSIRLLDVCAKHPTFAQQLSESLMEKIQDNHLVDNDAQSNLGLAASEFSLKLTRYLPTWLTVLGNCLVLYKGKSNFYHDIDLLLTLPICYNDDLEMACSWIRSLLNVFSLAHDNHVATKHCIERLAQLVDLEGRIESDRKANSCNESVIELVNQMSGEEQSPSPITFCEAPSDSICPLSPNVLTLLNDELLSQSDAVEDQDDKEKSVVCKQNELATLKLITLMEDWLRSGTHFDPSALQRLANHKYYQSVALKLCVQYEKVFGILPVNIENIAESKEVRIQLLRLLSLESFAEVVKVLNELEESQLRGCQDILVKVLAKHPAVIKDMVSRFSKIMWAYKTCCTALTLADSFSSLPHTLSLLASVKAVIDVCIDNKGSAEYQIILLKSIKVFLQNFEAKCLENLNANFSIDTDNVIAVLKAFQTCTRPVQSICSTGKSSNPELAAHVPVVKMILESVLFKVKILLKENNCLSAFWMGNLKDRQ